jgi:hypothetical protein
MTSVNRSVRLLVDRLYHVTDHSALAVDDSFGKVEHVIHHPLDVVRDGRDQPLGTLAEAAGQITAGSTISRWERSTKCSICFRISLDSAMSQSFRVLAPSLMVKRSPPEGEG